MTAASVPAYAAPVQNNDGGQSGSVDLPEVKEITAIDFTEMGDLKSLPDDWKIANRHRYEQPGGGWRRESAEAGKKKTGGNEISLSNSNLGISESEYRYVTIDTKIKMGSEEHANQFSIPYIQDEKRKHCLYPLYRRRLDTV